MSLALDPSTSGRPPSLSAVCPLADCHLPAGSAAHAAADRSSCRAQAFLESDADRRRLLEQITRVLLAPMRPVRLPDGRADGASFVAEARASEPFLLRCAHDGLWQRLCVGTDLGDDCGSVPSSAANSPKEVVKEVHPKEAATMTSDATATAAADTTTATATATDSATATATDSATATAKDAAAAYATDGAAKAAAAATTTDGGRLALFDAHVRHVRTTDAVEGEAYFFLVSFAPHRAPPPGAVTMTAPTEAAGATATVARSNRLGGATPHNGATLPAAGLARGANGSVSAVVDAAGGDGAREPRRRPRKRARASASGGVGGGDGLQGGSLPRGSLPRNSSLNDALADVDEEQLLEWTGCGWATSDAAPSGGGAQIGGAQIGAQIGGFNGGFNGVYNGGCHDQREAFESGSDDGGATPSLALSEVLTLLFQ
jgi:hypothetical protein